MNLPGSGAKEQAAAYVRDHLDEAIEKYIRANTSGGTLAISSDAARELLPGYATPAERTQNNFLLGEASSELADAVWQRAMSQGPTQERYIVEFLTGSPGSGKTRSLASKEDTELALITEGMMDHFNKSVARIQQAIDANFVPTLRLVYAIDPRTTLRRAVARAMEFGRPVRISQMSRLYVEIPKTVDRIAQHFGDKLGINVFDNSVDGRIPTVSTIETALQATGRYTEVVAREAVLDELNELRNDRKISPDLYRKFHGDPDPPHTPASGRGGGGPSPAGDGGPGGKD